MKKPIRPMLSVAILLCCSMLSFAPPSMYGAGTADKQAIVARARKAYYNLRDHGMVGFTSSVAPNWRLVLKEEIAADPASAEKGLTMLNGIHFTVALDSDGAVKVTHKAEVAPINAQAAEGFNQIFSGMEQAMTGFFEIWKAFMLTSPLPEVASDYNLEESENEYRLSYIEGTVHITTTMSKELIIDEVKVEAPEFTSVMKPQFKKSVQGLFLAGYEATYQTPGGGATTHLNVQIENQLSSDVQLPRKINLNGSYQGTPFQMELMFSDYRVEKR